VVLLGWRMTRCSDVIDAIKREFKNHIKSSQDFNAFIDDLKFWDDEAKLKLVIDNCDGILHQAVLDGKLDFINTLIKHGVKPTHDTLSHVCSTDNTSIIDIFLDGIEPKDIITSASHQKNIGLIQRLFDEEILQPTKEMLIQASEDNNIEVIQLLINNDVIQAAEDFQSVLSDIKPEQRTAIVEAIKQKLPSIIKKTYDFESALQNLEPEQRTVVYEAMKEELPSFITNARSLRRVLQHLDLAQRTAVFESMGSDLYKFFQESGDLDRIQDYLTPEQNAELASNSQLSQEHKNKSVDTFNSIETQSSMRKSLREMRNNASNADPVEDLTKSGISK
jgi:hypothetical protein